MTDIWRPGEEIAITVKTVSGLEKYHRCQISLARAEVRSKLSLQVIKSEAKIRSADGGASSAPEKIDLAWLMFMNQHQCRMMYSWRHQM